MAVVSVMYYPSPRNSILHTRHKLLLQRNCIKISKVLKQGSYENIQDPTLRNYVLDRIRTLFQPFRICTESKHVKVGSNKDKLDANWDSCYLL
jgi:hypothetical protein